MTLFSSFFTKISFLIFLASMGSLEFTENSKNGIITGTILNEEGQSLSGIEIINPSNNFVAFTNEKGNFKIRGKKKDQLIVLYPHRQITVEVQKTKNLVIHLKEELKKLEEKTLLTGKERNNSKNLKTISGFLYDSDGFEIPDAEISVRGTSTSTITNEQGFYTLTAQIGEVLLVIDPLGSSQEFKVTSEKMNLKFKSDVLLESVVTVAGFSSEPKAMGSSSVGEALEGRVAGLKIESADKEGSVKIRGMSSISEKSGAIISGTSSSFGVSDSSIQPGQLTAGEVNDFSHWNYWQGLTESEWNQWKDHWNFNPTARYSVILTNKEGFPIFNKVLHLKNASNKILWTSITDNTGRAELWLNPHEISTENSLIKLSITDDKNNLITSNPIEFKKGINLFNYQEKCKELNKVNIAFMVDATGSMGDELRYLQAELYDVIERTKSAMPEIDLSMGSVFYRDQGDEYVVKNFDFTSHIPDLISFIQKQTAAGGGDFPEAVVEAFEASIEQLSWDQDAKTKLLFVLLDAPPHHNQEKVAKLQKLTQKAAEKGIRIIPIAGSGIDKSTEFLMRAIALETNGTYLFLTDHSGIGNPHLEPSTESYKVEMFNDLLLRIIKQFTEVKTCFQTEFYPENKKFENKITEETTIQWSYSPNPTSGIVNVKISKEASEIHLLDTTGKLIFYQNHTAKNYQLNLTGLPTAVYYLKIIIDGKELYGKLIKK